MNLLQPISALMTTELHTLSPSDDLWTAKTVFDKHHIHHIPVVEFKEIVGMLSKTDLNLFIHGFNKGKDAAASEKRLKETQVGEIMTEQLAKLEASDRLRTALEVFKMNRFHALPVVKDSTDLIGIITTHDIIVALASQPVKLEDYGSM
ncbi:MAG: CBS domain-containing protein [Bacteroidia bacterium]|nr:CBS domain-containing protein [Bacteroidia bacterium]